MSLEHEVRRSIYLGILKQVLGDVSALAHALAHALAQIDDEGIRGTTTLMIRNTLDNEVKEARAERERKKKNDNNN